MRYFFQTIFFSVLFVGFLSGIYNLGYYLGSAKEIARRSSVSAAPAVTTTPPAAKPATDGVCLIDPYDAEVCSGLENAAEWEKRDAEYMLYRLLKPGAKSTLVRIFRYNCLGDRIGTSEYAKPNDLMEDDIEVPCPEE